MCEKEIKNIFDQRRKLMVLKYYRSDIFTDRHLIAA
jgi:hypothetical protein